MLVVGLLLGCSGTDEPVALEAASTSIPTPQPPSRLLTCGHEPFPAEALDAPPVVDEGSDPAATAARSHLDGPQGEEAYGTEAGALRVLSRDGERVQFAVDPPDAIAEEPFAVLVVERGTDGWDVTSSSGGCSLRASLDGRETSDWELDWRVPPPAPDAREVAILVQEGGCAGGQPATGRVLPPSVNYGPDAVTITVAVEPLAMQAECASNPPTPFRVELSEPLGERRLLDGGPFPARAVEEQGNVTLLVSNQGGNGDADAPFRLAVEVDGESVFDERLPAEQHGGEDLPLRLAPGDHLVKATAETGETAEILVQVDDGRRWVAVSWFGYVRPPGFSLQVFDEAPGRA